MGFLKFLKKEEKGVSQDHDLEIPAPPTMNSFGSELPSFSGPSMQNHDQIQIPSFQNSMGDLPEIKPFKFDELEEPAPVIPSKPIPAQNPPAMQEPEQIPAAPVREMKPQTRFMSDTPMFIPGHKYREIMEDLGSIANSKPSMEDKKEPKNMEFEKLSQEIEDLQRKLMEIDENIFEV